MTLYPIGPIETYLRASDAKSVDGQPNPSAAMALALNTDRQAILRATKDGIRALTADRWAVRLGLHPAQLWPSWFEDAEEEPRCAWCGDEVSLERTTSICSRPCWQRLRLEREHFARRSARWWRRLDHYRETVVIPEEDEMASEAA